ncbi:HlyD family type I secretion periplasmic adaptor subunit [Dickeya oryzae]|uniref:Membrane fusion protein (MFP) family protein n=1 Tax=Dickeya oryzae TaxID=1240404 RepID=A0ABS5BG41_9GAMM|nr:HlyD family type I secretion periplasmic adaptor subunit [Dickeya oryzae]MBP2859431.1 HlyD family type I secretion periplasmic adaptor subunit [Dickeya oryzae]
MLKLVAFFDLVRRYWDVLVASWSIRKRLSSVPRQEHELAFLPASIELAETPVHPAPRWAMRVIVALAVAVMLIGLLGKLDIVVVAKGKLVPDARVKEIQPAITGVVSRIAVEDGQWVTAGAILMELDPTQAQADVAKAQTSRLEAALAAARARALLDAQTENRQPVISPVDGLGPDDLHNATRFAEGIFHEYQDKISHSDAELAQHQAEFASTLHDIDRLRATAPLAREQASNYKALVKDNYVAKNDYLAKEQIALEQEHDLAAKLSHADELKAAIVAQKADKSSIGSQFRREQLDALDKAEQQFKQSYEDEIKAKTRQRLLVLTSPVAGTVQQLEVHTIGGVVTSAQRVMEIVPDDAMEIEVHIANKDIGFVRTGQEVVIKIEAFPYTYYGYVTGTVRSVSNDAVQDRTHELNFTARIHINTNRIHVGERWINLTPGMAITAEIKTGKRRVWEYFFAPLIRMTQESLRER